MIKYDYCHYFRASPPILYCNTISSPPNFVIKHQKRNNKTIECGGIAVDYQVVVEYQFSNTKKDEDQDNCFQGEKEKGAPWPPGAPDMANHWVYSWHAANTEYTEHTEYIILYQYFWNIHRTYNKYFSRNTNQGEIHLAKVIIHTFLKTMIWPNLLYCKGKWNKYQHFFFSSEGIWFWSLNIFVRFHWNPLSSSWVSLIVFFFSIKVALVFIFKILYKMRTEAFFVYFKR